MSQSIVERLTNIRQAFISVEDEYRPCGAIEEVIDAARAEIDALIQEFEALEEENSALSAQNLQFAEDIEKLTDQLEAKQAPSDERQSLIEICRSEIMANAKDQTTTAWVLPETPKRMLAALAQPRDMSPVSTHAENVSINQPKIDISQPQAAQQEPELKK